MIDPARFRRPAYDPGQHGVGIVHLGCGAFHRAHQAVYTDDALASAGGDWRIVAASLRSHAVADALNANDGRYTVLERHADGPTAREVASIERVLVLERDAEELFDVLCRETVHIVTLTVTEKAYALRADGDGLDLDDALVAADVEQPEQPRSVVGILAEALYRRRSAGRAPFTVLCCDNLSHNGRRLKQAVRQLAAERSTAFSDWIERDVAFPSTMVDRITPAATEATRTDSQQITGRYDLGAVECEAFSQWVVEDHFPTGRPHWEAGGALMVDEVAPYERMKLRMLNGAHSLMAYVSIVSGIETVGEAMREASIRSLVRAHLDAAAATLHPVAGLDYGDYRDSLLERFANPAIHHRCLQIGMDGTEKLPPRLLLPAVDAEAVGQDRGTFVFAIAAWIRFCLGRRDNGETYRIDDPRAASLARAAARTGLAGAQPARDFIAALAAEGQTLLPEPLQRRPWLDSLDHSLTHMRDLGMAAAVRERRQALEGLAT